MGRKSEKTLQTTEKRVIGGLFPVLTELEMAARYFESADVKIETGYIRVYY